MRIVRQAGAADATFLVYRNTESADKRVLELSRYVRDKGMPFLVGPSADDPELLMKVGPLDHTQAMTLESAFRRYFAP